MATPITPLKTTPTGVGLSSGFGDTIAFVTSNLMWIIVIIGVIFGIILFFWIMKKVKKVDPFMNDFKIKKNQCRMFKKSGVQKVFIENMKDGLIPMGTYEGECIDKEGFHNVMFSRLKFGAIGGLLRKVLFFTAPILDLLLKKFWIVRCNTNPIYIPKPKQNPNPSPLPEDPAKADAIKKKKKKKEEPKFFALPVPRIVRGGKNLIIHCMGLQLKKYYTYPILVDTSGVVFQDEQINFERERDSVLTDTLYEQTIDFANVMREAINLNPQLRYVVKTEGRTLPSEGGG